MYTIIKIDETNVYIGTDEQKIVKVPISALNFTDPQLGDEVKVYKADDNVIITRVSSAKVEEKIEEPVQSVPQGQVADSYTYQPPEQQQYQSVSQVNNQIENRSDSTLVTVIKVFLIIACIVNGICGFLIPLAWCIPMTVHCFRKMNTGQPISMAMKICTLIFVSLVSGICMLCMKDEN